MTEYEQEMLWLQKHYCDTMIELECARTRSSWRSGWFVAVLTASLWLASSLIFSPHACAASSMSGPVYPIPSAAERHRNTLVRVSRMGFGMDAPIATLAAQVHQESRWQTNAVSPVGATGIAQFMPATAKWMAELYPSTLGDPQPLNPGWALRAMVQYNLWHLNRIQARSPCDQWAMALAAYNGGLGWVQRDSRLALASGASQPLAWHDIEHHNAGRSAANFAENRHYVRVILTQWEPLYIRAGWGKGACNWKKLI